MRELDLKPVTQETIDSMGFTDHDLWLVKLEEKVYGPFEPESLRHYSSENEDLFALAVATPKDTQDWRPFYSYSQFQKRTQGTTSRPSIGPFWLIENGLKAGPLSLADLEKRVKEKTLVVTELVSPDEGNTWHKLFELPQFDRRLQAHQDLPVTPLESSFQTARFDLEEMRERRASAHVVKEDLASTAHQALQTEKTISFNINDVHELPEAKKGIGNSNVKWILSAAMSLVMSVVGVGSFIFSSSEEDTQEVTGQTVSAKPEEPKPVNPSAHLDMPQRLPSSAPPRFNRQSNTPMPVPVPTQYPTYTETHQPPPENHDPMLDPQLPDEQSPGQPQAPVEHSLVNAGLPNNDDAENAPQDAAMNAENPQPVVEESSDF
jgi:hypothetical protein